MNKQDTSKENFMSDKKQRRRETSEKKRAQSRRIESRSKSTKKTHRQSSSRNPQNFCYPKNIFTISLPLTYTFSVCMHSTIIMLFFHFSSCAELFFRSPCSKVHNFLELRAACVPCSFFIYSRAFLSISKTFL